MTPFRSTWLVLAAMCLAASAAPAAEETRIEGPFVTPPVTPIAVDTDLRSLPKVERIVPPDVVHFVPRRRPDIEPPPAPPADKVDPAVQRSFGPGRAPALIRNFDGIPSTGASPPDTVGAVGPDHYVQMVNTVFSVYDKMGTLLAGPSSINSLWDGFGGNCEAQNAGDPMVLYDALADRWLLSQFAGPAIQCVAISQTGDPISGGYFLYAFSLPQFPDYPKFGVWPDGYYMGANSNPKVFAMDRASMLAGQAAGIISFTVSSPGFHSAILPSDLDGTTLPPAGAPNTFYRHADSVFGGSDRIETFAFAADFDTPANSTFTGPAQLNTDSFTSLCNFSFDCVRQPSVGQRLDSITEWPMFRLAYRNFGTHESLVVNNAVNAGSNQAAVRWYELRKSGANPWAIHQQGTYAPDSDSRWMASMAMDREGNIAMGYSVSSTTVSPSLRYTGRLDGDLPLGTMTQGEATAIAGSGSQTGSNRWGDYSALTVDPEDDCTFWFTSLYQPASSGVSWRTRIFSFRFPTCGAEALFADGFESGNTAAWSAAVP